MANWIKNPSFARFLAASGASNLADGIAVVAWGWLASSLTRDPLLVAMLPMFLRLPWFLCAIPAGLVTDRADRRLVIIAADAMRLLCYALAGVAVLLALPLGDAPLRGVGVPWLFAVLCAAALLIGVAEVFRDNAAQTLLPALVPDAQLETANGRLWSVEMTGNGLLGPAIGAGLVGVSLMLPFAVNTAFYALSCALMAGLRGDFRASARPPASQNQTLQAEVMEAARFLYREPTLWRLAMITGVWNLCDSLMLVALVLYVQEVMGLGAFGYGLVLAAGALGAVIGGAIGGWNAARLGPVRTTQYTLAGSAPVFAAMGFAPNGVALGAALLVIEVLGMLWNTVSVSYRQRAVPDHLRGRVNSLYRMFAWGMMPVGMVLSGATVRLAELWLPRTTALAAPLWLAALLTLVLGLMSWRQLGRSF